MLPTAQEVAQRAARVVIDGLRRRARVRPVGARHRARDRVVASRAVCRAVACRRQPARSSFERARGFALDEYVGLPPGHPQSYREVLLREVCGPLGLPADRLHVPDGSGDSEEALAAGAAAYERRIAEAGGVDVQILGIGANGHLGFNEPGSALTSRTRVKRLSERTRADNARFFDSLDAVPTHCVTQGLGTVLDARRLVLVALGGGQGRGGRGGRGGPAVGVLPSVCAAVARRCRRRARRGCCGGPGQPRLLRRLGRRALSTTV